MLSPKKPAVHHRDRVRPALRAARADHPAKLLVVVVAVALPDQPAQEKMAQPRPIRRARAAADQTVDRQPLAWHRRHRRAVTVAKERAAAGMATAQMEVADRQPLAQSAVAVAVAVSSRVGVLVPPVVLTPLMMDRMAQAAVVAQAAAILFPVHKIVQAAMVRTTAVVQAA